MQGCPALRLSGPRRAILSVMATLLVHQSDLVAALDSVTDPASENYLCLVDVDKWGACQPGHAFKINARDPFEKPLPVERFHYLPMALAVPPRWL